MGAHARFDAAIAAFTLTSTPTTHDLGAKTQSTGERFGLDFVGEFVPECGLWSEERINPTGEARKFGKLLILNNFLPFYSDQLRILGLFKVSELEGSGWAPQIRF